jgi:hypothetical protein
MWWGSNLVEGVREKRDWEIYVEQRNGLNIYILYIITLPKMVEQKRLEQQRYAHKSIQRLIKS